MLLSHVYVSDDRAPFFNDEYESIGASKTFDRELIKRKHAKTKK